MIIKRLLHRIMGWHYDGSIGTGQRMGKAYWRHHTSCSCVFCKKIIKPKRFSEEK